MALWHLLLFEYISGTKRNTIRNIHSLMSVDRERQEKIYRTNGKVMAGEKLHSGVARAHAGGGEKEHHSVTRGSARSPFRQGRRILCF
jgi:hypothetical protein